MGLILKVLLIGGTGQLGSQISKELAQNKISYFSPSRKLLNLSCKNSLIQAFSQIRPSVVINCAAWTNVKLAESSKEEAFSANVTGVENLIEASKLYSTKIIHFSSDYVFDGKKQVPYLETDEVAALNFYGYTKILSERALFDQDDVDYIICRIQWLYSKTGSNFYLNILNKLNNSSGEVISVVTDQIGIPTSTNFVSRAVVRILETDSWRTLFHIAPKGQANWYSFALEIAKTTSHESSQIRPILTSIQQTDVLRPAFSALDSTKASSLGLIDSINWIDEFYASVLNG